MSPEEGVDLLARMGIEVEAELETADSEAGEGDEAQEPETEAAPQKFVHEMTGKEFDSELELLRYDSGYNNSKHGERIKALEAQLEETRAKLDKGDGDKGAQSDREVMQKLWKDYSEDVLNEGAAKFVWDGIKGYDQMLSGVVNGLTERIAALEGQIREERELSTAGVERSEMQKLLEKHPGLKALSPEERVAVMQDMKAGKGKAETPTPTPAPSVPKATAEDHVEGSAKSAPPEGDAGFDSWLSTDFKGKSIDDQQSILTQMIRKASDEGGLPI